MQNIKDKVIIITGASSGIGAVSAVELAKNGAKLVLGARRVDKLAQVESEIKALGGEVVSVATDVSKKEDVINLAKVACISFSLMGKISSIKKKELSYLNRLDL